MSLNGLKTYNDNIKKVQETDEYKSADTSKKLNIMYRLLNSKYGTRSIKTKKIRWMI